MHGIRRATVARLLSLSALSLIGLAAAPSGHVDAKAAMRMLANPPTASLDSTTHGYSLNVQLTDWTIFNPATGLNDKVRLRTYWLNSGPGPRPDSPLVGPTIVAHPGDKVLLELRNTLDKQPDCHPSDHNIPNCFNYTNFHTHGLWVSPSDNSDNVMLEVVPKESFGYQFDIPKEHPSGTFWYHSHRHGSTALQVASGMSGALIIRGDRKPTAAANGDIDTLLAPLMPKERIMLFQQIAYACGVQGTTVDWNCTGKTGFIDSYAQIGGGKWNKSGRFTSINGQVLPNFPEAKAGQIERWRMIHGGIANTINLVIRAAVPGATLPDKISTTENAKWVADNCTGEIVHQFAIASDGLTRSYVVDRASSKPTTMQPGYREDILLAFPRAATYCVIDSASAAQQSVSQTTENRALLGLVNVAPGKDVADQKAYMLQALDQAAQHAGYDAATTARVTADLNNGMRLSAFVPHKDLRGETNVGHQELAFYMNDDATVFAVSTKFSGEGAIPYDGRMARTLILGTTDEWKMTTTGYDHPFHVHVNPFQIVEILDKTGKDVSGGGEGNDTEFADMKGQWKDTLFVKQGYTEVVRTHYARFTGVFVLHCHILDHEDKGMMEKIQIVDKNAPPPRGSDTMPMKGMGH